MFEPNYLMLLQDVRLRGDKRATRAGPTRQMFGTTIQVNDLTFGRFPILTTRKCYPKGVAGELAAFLHGATTVREFKHFGCNYWDANAAAWDYNAGQELLDMDVGNIYGAKWRNFHGKDQLQQLIRGLRTDRFSRRHLLTTYDPSETWQCLPPCHLLAQFSVTNDNQLDCIVYMRSVDLCLGLPSDVILYALLVLLICNELDYLPGIITFMLGDTHIYENHLEGLKTQLDRPVLNQPKWSLERRANVSNFLPDMFEIVGYKHGDPIEYPFAA